MSVQEILEAHTVKRPWSEASRMRCKCGEVVTAETEHQLYTLHRAHVAEVLERYVHQTRRGVWDRAYSAGWNDGAWRDNPYTGKEPTNGRE